MSDCIHEFQHIQNILPPYERVKCLKCDLLFDIQREDMRTWFGDRGNPEDDMAHLKQGGFDTWRRK